MTEPVLSEQPVIRRRNPAKVPKALGAPKNHAPGFDGRVEKFPRAEFEEFCDNLMIQSKDMGLTAFKRLGSQMYLIDEIEIGLAEGVTFFVILKNRQAGISTLFLALDLFWAFKYAGTLGVFATHEEASRDQFRAQIDLFLTTIPKRYKIGAKSNNRIMLVLKNASLFRYLVAGQRTTTNKLGRSGGTNFAHMTEVAFWGSPEDLAALQETFSDHYPHRLYAAESTANGYNHFEEMWQIALKSPSQRAIFIGWWRDERNELTEAHPEYKFYMPEGTKTPLNEREVKGINDVWEQYKVQINAGQIAWYRKHLETKAQGDQAQMDQEQPWTPEDAFQSTGAAFFTNEALSKQFKDARPLMCEPYVIRPVKHFSELSVGPTRNVLQAQLKMWQRPSPWGKYAIGVDVAYGSSSENDLTVISVWRCFADRIEQVAEYATPDHSTYQCALIVAYLGGLYGDYIVNMELNGPGKSVMQEFDRLRLNASDMIGPDGDDIRNIFRHMKEFLYRRVDSLGGGLVRGWQTTAATKITLMTTFKNYIELEIAHIRSMQCIEECRRLKIDGGNIEADTGHDDRAIAAALAVIAWSQWIQHTLKRQGHTYAHSMNIEKKGGEDPMNGLVRRFMLSKNIQVRNPEGE